MRHVDLETYDALMSALYATALDPARWEDFTERLGQTHDAVLPAIYGHDIEQGTTLGLVSSKFDPAHVETFLSHYASLNPWAEAMARSPVGIVEPAEKLISARDLRQTEFYNDWIRPQGDIGTGAGTVLVREDGRMLAVCGNMPFTASEDERRSWSEMLTMLAPHIRRVFDMQRLLDRSHERGATTGAFDRMSRAAFLLDRKGRIVECNALAERLMAGSGLLRLSQTGELCCARPEAERVLKGALQKIVQRAGPLDTATFMLGERAGDHSGIAILMPFEADDSAFPFGDFVQERRAVAMMIVGARRADPVQLERTVRDTFDLTGAEAALFAYLCDGHSVSDYAKLREVSVHTVRTQLKSVFAKTKVKRQGELVSLARRLTII